MSKQLKIDLLAYLNADATIASLVGASGSAGGIWTQIAPEGREPPYVVLSMITEAPEYTQQSATEDALRRPVFQFDIFGATAVAAQEVCDAIRARIEGNKFTQGSTAFGHCFVDSEHDDFENVAETSGVAGLFRKILQVRMLIDT